jgi:hypothetical protein
MGKVLINIIKKLSVFLSYVITTGSSVTGADLVSNQRFVCKPASQYKQLVIKNSEGDPSSDCAYSSVYQKITND